MVIQRMLGFGWLVAEKTKNKTDSRNKFNLIIGIDFIVWFRFIIDFLPHQRVIDSMTKINIFN
jgi:hypothetical protein